MTKAVIKKNLCYEDYVKCLFTQEDKRLEISVIRSYKHDIYAETVNKIALSWNTIKYTHTPTVTMLPDHQ